MSAADAVTQDTPLVVITGSQGGLGSAISSLLQASGYRTIGIDRVQHDGAATGRGEAAHDGATGHTLEFTGDVGGEAVWVELADALTAADLQLTGLVNCAGASTRSTIETTSFDDWHTVLDSNLTATWLGMRSCLPLFRTPGAAVVNIGSIYGRLPPPGPPNPPTSPAYQAAKAGIVALTRAAAAEFGELGIRVNCLEPGLFSTPMTDKLPAEQFALRMQHVALRRSGDPLELAHAVEFFLSDKSSYINGVTMGVDGGYPLCL